MQSSPFEHVKLIYVQKKFEVATKFLLKEVASENGFPSISDMIRTWKGFRVNGAGIMTSISLEAPMSADRSGDGM